LTYSGRFTHTNGHPSGTGPAQNRKIRRPNVNINFLIPYDLTVPKMYRFAYLQSFWTKIHSEPD